MAIVGVGYADLEVVGGRALQPLPVAVGGPELPRGRLDPPNQRVVVADPVEAQRVCGLHRRDVLGGGRKCSSWTTGCAAAA